MDRRSGGPAGRRREGAAAAAAQSKNLPALGKAAMESCKDCEAERKKHADHHVIGRECMEACGRTIAACQKLTA